MADLAETNMAVAERIAAMLSERDVPVVVIGAVALAAHRYVRFTEDMDLEMIRETCKKYRLHGFGKILQELRQGL